MRKHLVWMLAIAVVAMSAGVAFAVTDNVSTVSMKVSPKKLDKKKFKPAGLLVETSTTVNGDPGSPTNPTLFPDPTTEVDLQFDDDIKFSNKGFANKCTKAKLESDKATTNQGAKKVCKGDLVGTGSAVACLNVGGSCAAVLNADVLAFNGKPSGKNLSFLLWTNTPGAGVTVLPAVLKSGGSGDFGSTLKVTTPPLGGGAAALTEFKANVKSGSYITARCHDKNKQLNVKSTFKYTNGATTDHPSASSKCST